MLDVTEARVRDVTQQVWSDGVCAAFRAPRKLHKMLESSFGKKTFSISLYIAFSCY